MSKGYKSPMKRNHGKAGGKRVFAQETGTVRMTRDGFVFVSIEGQDDDVYVPANKTRRALDGDTVRVAITRDRVSRSYDRATPCV